MHIYEKNNVILYETRDLHIQAHHLETRFPEPMCHHHCASQHLPLLYLEISMGTVYPPWVTGMGMHRYGYGLGNDDLCTHTKYPWYPWCPCHALAMPHSPALASPHQPPPTLKYNDDDSTIIVALIHTHLVPHDSDDDVTTAMVWSLCHCPHPALFVAPALVALSLLPHPCLTLLPCVKNVRASISILSVSTQQ